MKNVVDYYFDRVNSQANILYIIDIVAPKSENSYITKLKGAYATCNMFLLVTAQEYKWILG
jgi:hypothetical protein